jgi:hypothetical protein
MDVNAVDLLHSDAPSVSEARSARPRPAASAHLLVRESQFCALDCNNGTAVCLGARKYGTVECARSVTYVVSTLLSPARKPLCHRFNFILQSVLNLRIGRRVPAAYESKFRFAKALGQVIGVPRRADCIEAAVDYRDRHFQLVRVLENEVLRQEALLREIVSFKDADCSCLYRAHFRGWPAPRNRHD